MDGLAGWPTHLVRMTLGRVRLAATVTDLGLLVRSRATTTATTKATSSTSSATTTTTTSTATATATTAAVRPATEDDSNGDQLQYAVYWRNSALLDLVLEWLEEDFAERGPRKPRPRAVGC